MGRAHGFRRGGDVGPGLSGVLDEGFHDGSQAIDGGVPFRLVGILVRAERLQLRRVALPQHVEKNVFVTQRGIDELAFEDEFAKRTAVRVEEEPFGQVWRQVREVSLALKRLSPHRGRDETEHARAVGSVEGEGFFAGGIMQQCGLIVGPAGDLGLLVNDLQAGLAAHGGQAAFGCEKRLGHLQHWHILGPDGAVSDAQRLAVPVARIEAVAVNRVACEGAAGVGAAQIRRDGADRRLGTERERREEEAGQRLVIELHHQCRVLLRVVRAAVNPEVALAVLQGEGGIEVAQSHIGDGGGERLIGEPVAGERG